MAMQNEDSSKRKVYHRHSQGGKSGSLPQSQKSVDHEQVTQYKESGKGKSDGYSLVSKDQCALKKKKIKMKPKKKILEVQPRDEKLLKRKALKYLKQWKKDRSNWKFEKLRQIWLLQNMFDISKVPEKRFPVLVDYIMGAKGSARNFIRERALKVVQAMEQWTEQADLGLEDSEIMVKNPQLLKVSEESYSRARIVLQLFKEETNV